MFWYNKTVVEFDLVQHQISFARSSDVRLSFASPSITCPGKTNLMLDLVSSNNCLLLAIIRIMSTFWDFLVVLLWLVSGACLQCLSRCCVPRCNDTTNNPCTGAYKRLKIQCLAWPRLGLAGLNLKQLACFKSDFHCSLVICSSTSCSTMLLSASL